jgi:hypothetical protein
MITEFDNRVNDTLVSSPLMKLIAKVLALFVLLTSVASAWDLDNCGTDFVDNSAATVQYHGGSAPESQTKDLCGHCGHLGSHLLGHVTNYDVIAPHAVPVRHGDPAAFVPRPSFHSLFRPPRHSLSV